MDTSTESHLIENITKLLVENVLYDQGWDEYKLASMRAWDPFSDGTVFIEALSGYFREVEHSTQGCFLFPDFYKMPSKPFGVDFIMTSSPLDNLRAFLNKATAFADQAVCVLLPEDTLSDGENGTLVKPFAVAEIQDTPGESSEGGLRQAWFLWPGKRLSLEESYETTHYNLHINNVSKTPNI